MITVTGVVIALHLSPSHSFSKQTQQSIRLLTGLGIEGDAHCGSTMKHRGRLPRDASKPNTRQVHLVHAELHDDLRRRGFDVEPGSIGENITTRGVDLLGLPTGTRVRLGEEAIVEITGLRNPCQQLDGFQPGLMEATLRRDGDGGLVRLAGVMGTVVQGGVVRNGDSISVDLPPGPHEALQPV